MNNTCWHLFLSLFHQPERIDPPDPLKPDYDIRADVWSLGITLVELATGNFPYKDCKTDFEVLTKVLQDDPPSLPADQMFSPDFRNFVTYWWVLKPKAEHSDRNFLMILAFMIWGSHTIDCEDTAFWDVIHWKQTSNLGLPLGECFQLKFEAFTHLNAVECSQTVFCFEMEWISNISVAAIAPSSVSSLPNRGDSFSNGDPLHLGTDNSPSEFTQSVWGLHESASCMKKIITSTQFSHNLEPFLQAFNIFIFCSKAKMPHFLLEQELVLSFRLHGVTAQETTPYIFVFSVTVSMWRHEPLTGRKSVGELHRINHFGAVQKCYIVVESVQCNLLFKIFSYLTSVSMVLNQE